MGDAYDKALSILKEKDEILENVAQALLLVETIDGEQFEALYTGKITPEDLKANVDKAGEEKKARDAEEAAERERIRQEEQARLMEELKKYDGDYLEDEDPETAEPAEAQSSDEKTEAPAESEEEKEKEGEDESNS